jgi:uncharacterized membrane protein
MLIGLLFFILFFGLVVGAAIGVLMGHFAHNLIDEVFIDQVRTKITPSRVKRRAVTATCVHSE